MLIDGKAVVSCQQSLEKIDGSTIVTLEGIDQSERDAFANAFAACGGLQCGFCIPGIVMRAKAQIDKKGSGLTRDAMKPTVGETSSARTVSAISVTLYILSRNALG